MGSNKLSRSLLALSLTALVCGCAMDKAYRTSFSGEMAHCENGSQCNSAAAVEFRQFTTGEQAENRASGSYIMSFVEFDDQGWFHDLGQRTALFKALQAQRAQQPDTRFLIVTYTHGWKHSAGIRADGTEDKDIQEFRKLLERLALLEQRLAADPTDKRPPRKVVGVYIGWRGASLTLPLLENTTFWTRKNAGERVGNRSVKQFLMELGEYKNYLNSTAEAKTKPNGEKEFVFFDRHETLGSGRETQLILIGHSFGGLLMYHALHSALIERSVRIEPEVFEDQPRFRYDLAKSFGDFVLLVNPAFEGATYEPLAKAAQSRCYSRSQRPVMAVVTSKGDWATKYAFPAGRLYTWGQAAPQEGERDTVLHTVGHLDRYITHDLVYDESSSAAGETTELLPTTQQNAVKALDMRTPAGSKNPRAEDGQTVIAYKGAKLISKVRPQGNGLPTNYPYLVMSADEKIIKDHNDIWNERFVDFMISFIAEEVMKLPKEEELKKPEFHARNCVPYGQQAMPLSLQPAGR